MKKTRTEYKTPRSDIRSLNGMEEDTYVFFLPPFFPLEILLFLLQVEGKRVASVKRVKGKYWGEERDSGRVPDSHGCEVVEKLVAAPEDEKPAREKRLSPKTLISSL